MTPTAIRICQTAGDKLRSAVRGELEAFPDAPGIDVDAFRADFAQRGIIEAVALCGGDVAAGAALYTSARAWATSMRPALCSEAYDAVNSADPAAVQLRAAAVIAAGSSEAAFRIAVADLARTVCEGLKLEVLEWEVYAAALAYGGIIAHKRR